MARRALVLGSQIEGLRGVDNDTRRMAAMLESRGFVVDRRVGADATRAGMLDGYDRLIAASSMDDAAVVYYCGHGFYASVPEEGRSWQCIVPTDLRQGTATDWRGITAWELSIKQAQLTARTRNVTVILDCCHSAQLSRSEVAVGAVSRALPHPVEAGFDHHLTALRTSYGQAFHAVDPIADPHAVRLVACGQYESAFERADADGVHHGVFTQELIDVLDQVGTSPASWAAILRAVRARVLRENRRQRPDIEGPARRGPFSLTEHDDPHGVMVAAVGDRFRLSTGQLTGTAVGDRYGVLPADAPVQDVERDALAHLEVTEVFATTAHARRTAGATFIPRHAVALPIQRRASRWPVAIDAPPSASAAVVSALAASPTLRAALPGETREIATVRIGHGEATVEDAAGPLGPPVSFPSELGVIVVQLANLGVAQGVRELEGEHGVRADELAIELGTVHDGQRRRRPDHGAVIQLRDRYYLTVERRGPRTVFVHVLSVGARGKITLLTQFSRGGVALDGHAPSMTLGQRPDGELRGVGLLWPQGMSRTGGPRLTELIVLATPTASDISGLETREVLGARNSGTQLECALAELCDGVNRGDTSLNAPANSLDGFLVKRLSILLDPGEPAAPELA